MTTERLGGRREAGGGTRDAGHGASGAGERGAGGAAREAGGGRRDTARQAEANTAREARRGRRGRRDARRGRRGAGDGSGEEEEGESEEREGALHECRAEVRAAGAEQDEGRRGHRSEAEQHERAARHVGGRAIGSGPEEHHAEDRTDGEEQVVEALVVGHALHRVGAGLIPHPEALPDARPRPLHRLHDEDVHVQQRGENPEHRGEDRDHDRTLALRER